MEEGGEPMKLDTEQKQRLTEIRARAVQTTPGPWGWRPTPDTISSQKSHFDHWRLGQIEDTGRILMADHGEINDAEFIAQARSDIPWLLKLVDKLVNSP